MQYSRNATRLLPHPQDGCWCTRIAVISPLRRRRPSSRRCSYPLNIECFSTSIWDETLYKACSSIVYSLIPNVDMLQQHL
eukprot:EC794851.1.p4 GENE.EC794851.1~~EC794851.1.p4  ORF type:complete len:80 (+),score=15.69 EC794851.1:383-622(+)